MTSVNVDVLDQLTHNLSTRRRILSGFGFGLGISLALLSFFLISNSNNSDPLRQTYFLDSLFSSFAPTHPPSSYPSHLLNNATNPPNRTETHDPTTIETGADAGNLSFPLEVKSGAKDAPERPQTLTINATIVAAEQDLSPNPSPQAGEAAVQEQKNRTQPVDLSVEVRNVSFHGGQGIPSVGDVLPYRKVKDSVRHGNSREEKAGAGFSPRDAELLVGCDLFDGRWVKDYTKPFYPPGSCPYVDTSFDCHGNRRPDDNYLRWRWQPNGCLIPRLNATDFLERMRGKKLVFVGDSLNRNMWESLVCILRHSIRNKKRVYEISGKREFKKKGFYAFIFEEYNCTVDFVGAPFLVRPSSFQGKNGTLETLRLDLMDETTKMYLDADIVVFNTGHWWTHEKTSRGEDYYQEGNYVYPKLNVVEAYEKALFTWAKWVDKHIDSTRTLVFFRGYAETHFKGGQWNSGGQCHKETEPIFNQTYLRKYNPKMKIFDRVLKGMKTPVIYLNITRLTDYRKDGHPSIYRKVYDTAQERLAAEHSQDCSHWCLPGVPDIWNELLYASLLKAHTGR